MDVDICNSNFQSECRHLNGQKTKKVKRMSTYAIKISEADVNICNDQKTKKKVKWMSTSTIKISEADVDIRNSQKKKKIT